MGVGVSLGAGIGAEVRAGPASSCEESIFDHF